MSISLFRSLAGQYEHLREVNTVSMMNTISHHIEDQVMNHRLAVDFYAGFQRFSLFPDQMRRYQRLGAVCRRVYIFGVPDVRPPTIPGVEYISLDPTSPLAKEWFVLVDTPEFWTVLATQEQDGRDQISGGRRFDGLWTFDEKVVDRASLLISQTLDGFYQPVSQRNYEQQNVHITEISTRMISQLERTKIREHRRRTQVSTMQQFSEKLVKGGPVDHVYKGAAQVLNNVFGASGVVITLYDSNNTLNVVAAEGEVSVNGNSAHTGAGPVQQAISQTNIVQIPDTRKSFDRDPYLPTAQMLMAAPIVGRSKVHGAVILGANQPELWSDDDGNTIMALARMLAIPVESGNGASADAGSAIVNGNPEQWQAPMAYLLTLHQKLRADGTLTQDHLSTLDQIDRLSIGLAQAIGVPEKTIRRILAQAR